MIELTFREFKSLKRSLVGKPHSLGGMTYHECQMMLALQRAWNTDDFLWAFEHNAIAQTMGLNDRGQLVAVIPPVRRHQLHLALEAESIEKVHAACGDEREEESDGKV